jgi:hypothetical protein
MGILALGLNGVQKLWKWSRNEQNPSGKVMDFTYKYLNINVLVASKSQLSCKRNTCTFSYVLYDYMCIVCAEYLWQITLKRFLTPSLVVGHCQCCSTTLATKQRSCYD